MTLPLHCALQVGKSQTPPGIVSWLRSKTFLKNCSHLRPSVWAFLVPCCSDEYISISAEYKTISSARNFWKWRTQCGYLKSAFEIFLNVLFLVSYSTNSSRICQKKLDVKKWKALVVIHNIFVFLLIMHLSTWAWNIYLKAAASVSSHLLTYPSPPLFFHSHQQWEDFKETKSNFFLRRCLRHMLQGGGNRCGFFPGQKNMERPIVSKSQIHSA